MDPFISPIYEKIIDLAALQLVKQAGYLLHYKDNFKELDDKVNKLQGARQLIQHWIEEEERKHGNQREDYVQDWIDRVDKLNEEAKELVEDPRHAGVGCHQWSCPNLRSRRKLSKMAKEMAESVTKLEQVGNFVRVTFSSPINYLESFHGALGFESRMPVMNNMMEALKDPKKRMIGVYGLGGVGKTTLARQVANKAKMDNLFNVVVEAKVGENPELEKMQEAIAELLDMKLEEKTVTKRADRIRKRIEREKSILVILDDVRTTIELEEIGIPDPSKMNLEDGGVSSATNFEKGKFASKADNVVCKILITSRTEDILLQLGSENNFRIELLNETEAWSLFEVMAGLDIGGKHKSLRQIAPQVAQKCGGLPVVISAMAKTLKNRKIQDWKAALKKLRRAETKEMQEIIYSALELCYHWLENDEVKTLFLICSVINTNGIGWVVDLLKYGFGLGIFKGAKTVEEAWNDLYRMISSLKASCLILDDTSTEFFTMHDTVREVATSIASRNQSFFTKKDDPDLEEWPHDDLKRCRLIKVGGNCIQKLPERLDCPKLEFFCLDCPKNRSLVIPHSFFERMDNLKVLDLTGIIMSSLPTSIASLTKVKTLCLDLCALEDMTGIGALKNLEILSLAHSSMIQLPGEIGNLTHLRMLDLRNSRIEVIPPDVISNLIKLEELYMGNCSIKWEVESLAKQNRNATLAELKHLTNLTALEIQIHDARMLPKDFKFEKLEKYKIIIGDIWDWSENYDASKLLKLKLGFSIELEHWVKALIKTVENLYLDEINDISNVLYQLNEKGFPLLKHLYIQNNAKIQHVVNSIERNRSYVSFPNLETLELNNLGKLEKICHGPLMANSFSKLMAIKVKSCDQLEYLMLVSMVKALSQLLEIEVSECNSIKKIVYMECEDNEIIIDEIEFTPLRSLTLQHLPIIDNFYSNELKSSVAEPKYMSLRTTIPTSFFNAKLAFPNLETLKLSSINLNKIWDDHQLPAVASSIRNLANLIVENCVGLKYLFSSLMVESLTNLKHLEISECDMMEDIIFTERKSNGVALAEVPFSKLEKITIKDMKNLKAVWHQQFDRVKMLEVINCDKLGNIFPSHMQRTFRSLETLRVSDCNSVEEIFELSANVENGTTQLKQLTLLRLPKLKRIWSEDPQKVTRFHNLQFVCVEDCEDLEYLFPFSIATDLLQVEEITIKQAYKMKEIVSEKEKSVWSSVKFEFETLTSLTLCNLIELRTFYAGNHSVACPSLKEINVFNCKKFKLFKKQRTNNQGRISDSKLQDSMQQPIFNNVEEVIENLEMLTLNGEDASTILQCQLSRDQLCKLKILRVSMFKNDQATFPHWFLQNTSSLEWLVVEWSSFDEVFQYERLSDKNGKFEISTRIKYLRLHELHKLQHIFKEESQIDPFFEALEGLFVSQCSSLRDLVPSSIAFNYLTYLEVENCSGLVSLITSSTARSMAKLTTMKVTECNSLEQIVIEERDVVNRDIVFTSLEILELECLPRLNKFCSSECFLNFPLLEKVVVRQCPRMTMFSARETSTPRLLNVLVEENGEGYWEGDLNRTINKMSEDLVAFHGLKNLELSEYPELQELWYGQVGNKVFSNLTSLVVQKCDFLTDVLLTWKLLQALSNMEELDVRDCDSLQVVFDLSGMNKQEMQIMKETIQLRKITVSSLPKLKHIWKHESQETESFEITGEEDEVNLQHQQPLFLDEKPLFPKLETVIVSDLENLKTIWHPSFADPNSFGELKMLEVNNCEQLENIFPSYMPKAFESLETLIVTDCGSVEHISELSSSNGMPSKENSTQLRNLTLLRLPEMKRIWSKDPHGTLRFSNLQAVQIESCPNLEYLFPFSIAMDLPQLEQIHMTFCGVKEIVAMKDGPMDETPIFVLNHLTFLDLRNLHELTGFYTGVHSVECPSLKKLNVFDCKKFKLFPKRCLESSASDELHFSMPQPLFPSEEVIGNLEEFTLNYENANTILQDQLSWNLFSKVKLLRLSQCEDDQATFPYLFLQNIPSLETLVVEFCSFKEILYDEKLFQDKEQIEISSLRHICKEGSLVHLAHEVLQNFIIIQCSNLIHLAPSSVAFNHLTYLEVEGCNKMVSLVSSSTATSLVKLTTLKVRYCDSLEQIVDQEEDETKEEIAFNSLESLVLENLRSLNSFSSTKCLLKFPVLEIVVVKQCGRMKIFSPGETSTPGLEKVLMEENDEECFWEGDLNRTINTINLANLVRSFNPLELSEHPDLKVLWNGQVDHKIFSNLTSLSVVGCDFLPNALLPSKLLQALSNLEELSVEYCNVLQVVFDLNGMNEKEMLMMTETIKLRTLTLRNMPKLEHIWTRNSQEIVSLGDTGDADEVDLQCQVAFPKLETLIISNLQNLKTVWHPVLTSNSFVKLKTFVVDKCEELSNIFPCYMLRICATLETLKVTNCNSVEVIFQLSANELCSGKDTAQLKHLTLLRLRKLRQIWSGDPQRILGFHNLQQVTVNFCEDLEYIFPLSIAMGPLLLEKLQVEDCGIKEIVVNTEQPLLEETVNFVLNHLVSLKLEDLHKLEGFYAWNYTLECQSLKEISAVGCNKLELFRAQSTGSQERGVMNDEKSMATRLSKHQPPFIVEEVVPNLQQLEVKNAAGKMIFEELFFWEAFSKPKIMRVSDFVNEEAAFPYRLLQTVSHLKVLVVERSSFKKIFHDERPACEERQIISSTRLKKLKLLGLSQLEHICKEGFQIDPSLEVLESLYLDGCSKLTHVVPSSVTFSHLTYMEVKNCNGLMHLFTSTTARSLVKLICMKIRKCSALEQIVTEEADETEHEIAFNALETIELECLPMLKKFCSSTCFLKFPSLEKVVMKQCSRMEVFSVKEAITPKLQNVEADDKWCRKSDKEDWEKVDGDLNRIINKMFHDMAIREEDEGKFKEYSLSNISTSEEHVGPPKLGRIVDTGKQERHKLPSLSDEEKQKDHATSGDPPQDAAIEAQEMCDAIKGPIVQLDQNALNPTTVHDTGKSRDSEISLNENLLPNQTTSSITVDNIETTDVQEICEAIKRPVVRDAQNALSPTSDQDRELRDPKILIGENLFHQTTTLITADNREANTEARKTFGATERRLVQTDPNALNPTTILDAEKSHAQETPLSENLFNQTTTSVTVKTREAFEAQETIERPLVQDYQNAPRPTTTHDAAIGDQDNCEAIEKPLVQPDHNTLSPITVQEEEESHHPKTPSGENFSIQTTTSITDGGGETNKAQEMCATIERPLVQGGQNILSPTKIQDAGSSGSGESYDQEILIDENSFIQTTTSICADNKETNEAQEVFQPDHTALSPPIVQDAGANGSAFDPAPPQAPEAKTSSTVAPDAYTSYKGLFDISVQNLAYLEAGVDRHPQVLEWLNPKRRRVFASSFFSLFADVTGLLRTTRRGDLSHEDRDYITQCCTSLEGVGFDASWLSYVGRCVEECGEGEMVKKTLEETEGKASTLKAQLESLKKELASVEASLGLLRHKASKLDDFIES